MRFVNQTGSVDLDGAHRERAFPEALKAADRVDPRYIVVDETEYPVPLSISEIVSNGGQFVFVLERFGNTEVGYRCRDRNREGS